MAPFQVGAVQDQQDPAAAYNIRQLSAADLPALQAFMEAVSHHGYIRMRKNGRQVEDYKIGNGLVYFNRLKVYIFSIANHCELKWQTLAKFRQVDVFAKDDGAMAWIEKPEPEDTAKLEQLRKAQV